MDTWKLEIRKVDNGYILKGKLNDSNIIQEKCIEEKEANDLNTMQNVLWTVMEYFGIYSSKHNEKNLKVIIEDKNGQIIENN